MSDLLASAHAKLKAELAAAQMGRAILQAKSLDEPDNVPGNQVAREAEMRKGIDDCCRHWIEHGKWPAMKPDDTAFVYDRLNEAFQLLMALKSLGLNAP